MLRLALPLACILMLSACAEGTDPFVEEDPVEEAASEGEERQGSVRASFGEGIVLRPVTEGGVAEAVARLETALEEQGFTIVAKLDHQESAASVDLEMTPATVIFFGKPEIGTHLMKAAPSAAFDLPQRMTIYEDSDGQVVIAYTDPQYLATRHNITEQDERLEAIGQALSSLASIAAGEEPGGAADTKDTEDKD